MADPAFVYLCNDKTELVCLENKVFGGSDAYPDLRAGHILYLMNFQSKTLKGPYCAETSVGLIDRSLFGKMFLKQVRIWVVVVSPLFGLWGLCLWCVLTQGSHS